MELHRRVVEISTALQIHFDVEFPEMNATPILSRFVHELMLPSTFYVGAKSLLTMLRIDMHVRSVAAMPPNSAARARVRQQNEDGQGREMLTSPYAYSRNTVIPRCVMLMSVLILLIKLRYGLDGIRRYEAHRKYHPLSLHSGAPEQEAWLDAICELHGLPVERQQKDNVTRPAFKPWDTGLYVNYVSVLTNI